MTPAGSITSVIVAGGGISAWSAAAALKRRIPSLAVSVVSMPVPPNALADRVVSTLPSIQGFHSDIGLTDEDTVTRAASGLRLGSLFEGWAEGRPSYVHAYGPYGAPVDGVAFHELWLREHRNAGLPPFDSFSPAAEMARSGRTAVSPASNLVYGLQLSLDRYGELLRAYALHLGVSQLQGSIADVALGADDGFIERIVLADGRDVTADLFVDATGPAAQLHSRIGSDFIDWRQWLPSDRLLMSDGPADPSAIRMDRVTAVPFGWRWVASSPKVSSSGLVYSSTHASDDAVTREFDGRAAEPVELKQGRRREFWVRNCVAIGDAAVTVEPLEWTNLHLLHSQIDRMIAMMPSADYAPVELAEFNRQCAAEADRVRDFVCLHYVCAQRSEPFWKDAASIRPPAPLAHTLEQFAERARLPFYEEETFARDSWLAVLFGQGFEPARADPLTDLVPAEQAAQALRAMRQTVERSPASLPTSTLIDLNPRGAR
jgi:tryptophan halogenase